jgi:hypothetical protein
MPALLIGAQLGMSALSSAAQYGQAKQQYKRQNQANALNRTRIREDLNTSYGDNLRRAMQEMVALRTSLEDDARDALRQRGTAITASGEAGVEGLSVDLMLADLDAQYARGRDRQTLNYEYTLQELAREQTATRRSAESALLNMPQPIKPSAGLALLGAATGAAEIATPYAMRYAEAAGTKSVTKAKPKINVGGR